MSELDNLRKQVSEAPAGSDPEHVWIIDTLVAILRYHISKDTPKASTSTTAAANITHEEIEAIRAILPEVAFDAISAKGTNARMKPETVDKKQRDALSALLANPESEIAAHIKRVNVSMGITDEMIVNISRIR